MSILGVSMVIGWVMAFIIADNILKTKYKDFLKPSLNEIQLEALAQNQDLLNYRDAAIYYEKKILHNSNANLMVFGKYYANNNIVAMDTPVGLNLIMSGNSTHIHSSRTSFIGILRNKVYFRDDSDCAIYTYDLDTKQKSILADIKAGEMIVAPSGIYFINFKDNNCLYHYSSNGFQKKISNHSVSTFALFGNVIYFLSKNNVLYCYDKNTRKTQLIQENVKTFLFSKELILENNGGSIFQISSLGLNTSALHSGKANLLGVNPQFIAYHENGGLYLLNRDTLQHKLVYKKPLTFLGVNFTQRGLVVYGINSDILFVIEEISFNGEALS
jgi:outer membrane protein assembly factor BamB